jgi:hypothetical protein
MPMKSLIKNALGEEEGSSSDTQMNKPGPIGMQTPRSPIVSPDDDELSKIVETL